MLVYLVIGCAAVYQGLNERAALTRQEAEVHYQRGLAHLDKAEYELAMAELEHALSLDPTHRDARDALRRAKSVAAAQPTPTSATRNEAVVSLLAEAEALVQAQKWADAVQRLTQVHDLDHSFQPERVSELLYTANYNLGLEQVRAGQVEEGLHAFERALAERPGDAAATQQRELASLYVSALAGWGKNWPDSINLLKQLYARAPDYADVGTRLYQAYEGYGDALAEEKEWCQAEPQYQQAVLLRSEAGIQAKHDKAQQRCRNAQSAAAATPEAASVLTGTVAATAAPPGAATASGSIVFSRYNAEKPGWEIVSVAPQGGSPVLLLSQATQPAISPDGRLLAYHGERDESMGLHVLDLTGNQDTRVTRYSEDITPDWAPDNVRLVFPSQRSGDRRWFVYIGWADGKGEAVSLIAGRTPAWSPDGAYIAFQGTDSQGNNPGLYLIKAEGGAASRLTQGESDRSPAWSPVCAGATAWQSGAPPAANATPQAKGDKSGPAATCQIAYMSNRGGSWQLYLIDAGGGSPQPLGQAAGNNGLPIWSPDGRQLAFVSDRDGSWGVHVTPVSGGQAPRLADWSGARPDWLLDRIAWRR
jgi:tetratricopeptide (TPR) repeat protein